MATRRYSARPRFAVCSTGTISSRRILRCSPPSLDHPLPYGRIIRNAGGQIIDIIEDTEASAEVREIRELNVGAYAVALASFFPPSRGSRLRRATAITG